MGLAGWEPRGDHQPTLPADPGRCTAGPAETRRPGSERLRSSVLTPAPAILSGSFVNGQFRLTVTAEPGLAYAIQISTNLTSWVSLVTNTASPGGTIKFTDTSSPTPQRRFYRTKRLIP